MYSYEVTQFRKPFNCISDKIYSHIGFAHLDGFDGNDAEAIAARLNNLVVRIKKNNPRATSEVNIECSTNVVERESIVRVSNGQGTTCLLIRVVTREHPEKFLERLASPVLADDDCPF